MCLVWGLTWLPVKIASETVPPVAVAALRFVAAGLLFGLIVALRRVPLRTERPLRLLAASLLVTTFSYALVFWGVSHAPTGLSAIVNMSLIPVASMVIGFGYGEETISRRRVGALAIGAAGLVLLFWTSLGRSAGSGREVGLGLAALAAGTVFYAWGAVISRPLTREMPALAIAFWETAIGGLALLALAVLAGQVDGSTIPTLFGAPRALASLAFLVLAGSIVGFGIYVWLLGEWGPFRAGLYSFVSPAVAVAVGIVVLGESLGATEIAGCLAMVCATAFVIRRDA